MKKLTTIYISILVLSFQGKAQIHPSELTKTGAITSQMAIDALGKMYYPVGRFMVGLNLQSGVKDTLFATRQTISGLALSNQDSVLYFTHADSLWKYPFTTQKISSLYGGFQYLSIITIRKSNGDIYAMETGGDNGRASAISRIDPATGIRTRVAGQASDQTNQLEYVNAIGDTARFGFAPQFGSIIRNGGLAFSLNSDTLFIGDFNNRCIRKLNVNTRQVWTHAGPIPDSVRAGYRDGDGDNARFNEIQGLEIDDKGYLYVADKGAFSENPVSGNRIRKISPGGRVNTLLGNGIGQGRGAFNNLDFTPGVGTSAHVGLLSSLVFSPNKDTLYAALAQRILKIVKRKSSLRFNNLQDRMVGSGKYGVSTLSNSAVPKIISTISLPSNVTFLNDTANVPSDAATGFVILKAEQNEDLDSIYTTTVLDTFIVIPFVSNKVLSKISLIAYPNPLEASEWLQIEGHNISAGKATIELRDALGRIMLNEEIKLEGQFLKHQIRMPEMAGLYWINLRIGGEILKASIVTRKL